MASSPPPPLPRLDWLPGGGRGAGGFLPGGLIPVGWGEGGEFEFVRVFVWLLCICGGESHRESGSRDSPCWCLLEVLV
jgi:hypothetical protein